MKKLVSMVDFVLEQNRPVPSSDLHVEDYYHGEYLVLERICNYAQFLKQPLTLGMFVPCDEDGNFIDVNSRHTSNYEHLNKELDKRYEQAKERVLFDGFYTEFNAVMSPSGGYLDVGNLKHKIIETLVGANLTLTPYALKQIGV